MLKNEIYFKLKQVPKGRVITYKELAKAVNSKAYRYVGLCMKENKNPGQIPCYKVVKSDGKIGEYSGRGGVKTKIKLLKKDRIEIIKGRIDLKTYLYKFN